MTEFFLTPATHTARCIELHVNFAAYKDLTTRNKTIYLRGNYSKKEQATCSVIDWCEPYHKTLLM